MLGILIRKKIKMPTYIGYIPNLMHSSQLGQRIKDSSICKNQLDS